MKFYVAVLMMLMLSGCATHQAANIDELLKAMNSSSVRSAKKTGDGISPDTPSSNLPTLENVADKSDEVIKTTDLTIQPDCLLQISIEEDRSLDGSYPVNELGAVELGYVGPVILYNKTEREAEKKIKDVLQNRDFKNATVKVRIIRASYDKIQVIGVVNKPGYVRIGAGDAISLTDALLRSGGLRTSVKGAKVKIIRNGQLSPVSTALEGEVYDLETTDGKPSIPDVKVRNNDVVNVFSETTSVPELGIEKEIIVLGEVPRQGVYRFAPGEPCTMMHLAFKIGDMPLYTNKKEVRLIRKGDDGKVKETIIDLEKILKDGKTEDNVGLEHGDKIIFSARKLTLF